jgi:hypothetical protein
MRAHLLSLTVVAVACSGCASLDALRAHADGHASLFVSPPLAAPLEPASGLFLVSAQPCAEFAREWGTIVCVLVVGAVDLVALPVQALRRHGQLLDVERIAASCPLTDPATRFADDLADKMIQEFHFSPTPADTPAKRRGAVLLEVRTASFTRSSRIEWEGRIVFRSPDGEVLWQGSCDAQAPARDVDAFEHECEAARVEVAALADQCARSVVRRIRDAWPPEPTIPVSVPIAASLSTSSGEPAVAPPRERCSRPRT